MSTRAKTQADHSSYVVPIGLGTPGIAYPLQLDTGMSDLLLASSGCESDCPESSETNPYYELDYHSSSFVAVGNNDTMWKAGFGDGSVASGFMARERVGISTVAIDGQVFGLMNATNLTLAEQQVSGILGFGFPRLSVISRALLHNGPVDGAPAAQSSSDAAPFAASAEAGALTSTDASATTTSPEPSGSSAESQTEDSSQTDLQRRQASSSSPASSSAAATAPAPAQTTSAYLPPVLESLVTKALVPYPAFGLGLSPPADSTFQAPDPSSKGAKSRYSLRVGSLTLGGVSEHYISTNETSGRTVKDIEWHPVVPFAPLNASTTDASSSPASSAMTAPTAAASAVPFTATDLENEAYLYWALQITNVALNNTVLPVNSTYRSLGLPSIAVIDVGSNGIYGPQQDVAQIFTKIKDARQVAMGQWAVPCNTQATIGFSFGGQYIKLQPSDWMYAAVAGSSFCLAWPVAVPSSGDGVDWTLGTPFLKNVYTVFSYGINAVQAPQIGFLPLRDVAPTTATSTVPITPAALTVTVATTLPNQLITGPNYPTPSYIFQSPLPTGAPQSMGLANSSAYSVGAVPVVSLPRPNPNSTTTTEVPGWPGDSTEHARDAGLRQHVNVGGVLLAMALVAAVV